MRKRQIKFIVALCVIAVIVWILGEIVFGLALNLGMTVSRVWAVIIVIATCAFSVWKCPRDDGEEKKK